MIATKKNTGFTIIELMLVIAIIGLLATFAYPAYQKYIMRTKRSDAKVALAALQQAMEKYRANHPEYPSTIAILGASSTSPKQYYNLNIVIPVAAGCPENPTNPVRACYRLVATATGEQMRDTACMKFSLNQKQEQTAQQYTGGSYSTATEDCWK